MCLCSAPLQDRAGGADVNKSFLEIKTVVDTTITLGSCYCWVLLHISLWCVGAESKQSTSHQHQHCSKQRGLIESGAGAGLYGSVATCSAVRRRITRQG